MSHWEPVIGIALGFPAIGFAMRMVIRAVTDGIARIKAAGHPPLDPARDEQAGRIAQLEAELGSLRDEVGRLSAVESFYAQLQAPPGPGRPDRPAGAG